MHVREQVCEAVQDAVTGLDTTGANVFADPIDPFQLSQTPALAVYSKGDRVAILTVNETSYERQIDIIITAIVSGTGSLRSDLNQVCSEVETALGDAIDVNGKSITLEFNGSEIDYSRGAQTIGVCEMRFIATVFHNANAPDVLL